MDKVLRRKSFLTGEPAQWKFLSLLIVSMLAPLFLVGSSLYFIIFKVLLDQQMSSGSSGYVLYPVVMKANIVILVALIPLSLMLFVWGVIVSHRFTGPLRRLQSQIDAMAESGDFKTPLTVRNQDYIKPLVDSFNRLLDKLR